MGVPPIELVAVCDAVPDSLLQELRALLEETFGSAVRIGRPLQPDGLCIGPWDRLSSNAIVDALIARSGGDLPDPAGWVLGITAHDLVAPSRAYVFGEAALGGAWAVVSLARLLPPGHRDLDRLRKEIVHELGHVAGLDHCRDPRCVMHPSQTPQSIDEKGIDFCLACRNEFQAASGTSR